MKSLLLLLFLLTGVHTFQTQGLEFPLEYNLKAEGTKLSGTGLSPDGVLELTSCALKGNDFSFEMMVSQKNVKHTCKYYPVGDSVSVDIFYDGHNMHSTLLRGK